jgi:DNA-binding transcriptional LysR family regulator
LVAGSTLALAPEISLRHVRYFLAVFEELHFGRAAEKLHISQPPLSQAIRKLESALGAQLLERTSRTVRPTTAGRVFAEEARKALMSFEFAVAEARRADHAGPPVRVGCVTYVPTPRLQGFLTALKRRETSLRAEVTHMLGLEQVDRLRAGELDLGVFAHAEDYEGLEWERLFPGEKLIVFLPRSHPLAAKPVLTPDDLTGETFVMYPRSTNPVFYDKFMALLERTGYRIARRHETNTDPRDLLLAVAGGLGIAFAPVSFEERSLVVGRELIGVPLDPPVTYPDIIVAWRASPPRQLSSRLSSVREAASELFSATNLQVKPSF